MAVCNAIMLSEVRSGFRIDSEFYKKEYIAKDLILSKITTIPLRRISKVTDGEHGSVTFVDSGIKYLTAEHIKQGYVGYNGVRFVSPEVDQRNARARVSEGDILVSIKGTLGEIALAEKDLLPARDVAIIKLHFGSPSGAYITPFLRSKFGAYQLSREGSGGVQQMITLERLKCVLIPLLDSSLQNEIASLHLKGLSVRQKSLSLYNDAQHLLESELGLDKLEFKKPVGYTARFSETYGNGRFDADYYHPQFAAIQQTVKNYSNGYEPLISIAAALKPNIEPAKKTNQLYNYIELSNINPTIGTVDGFGSMLGKDLPSRARRQVINGDVIASAVVGSVDKAAIIDAAQSGFIASTGFFHFRPMSVSSEYLLILVKSKCVCVQFQQQSTGGILSAVPDSRLKNIIVPKLPDKLQQKIRNLVFQSHRAKKRSQELLDQAKSRVEQLIEEAAAR